MPKRTRVRGSGVSRHVHIRVKQSNYPKLLQHAQSKGQTMSGYIRDLLKQDSGLSI